MTDRDLSGHTLGEFHLRKLIGEGGYGAVYLAAQPALEREVVVKVLREERDSPGARERFLREARLAAQLRHPYAAQVYAFGTAFGGSLLWIAMELVQGVSLAEWLAQHGRMPPERFVPFFDHVCQVVHALHERNIVHRDLKPSNIMVVECGDRLTPKLLDLGIARESWRRRSELARSDCDDDPGERREVDRADGDRADGDAAVDVVEWDDEHDTDPNGDTDPFGARTERLPVRPRRAKRAGRCYDSEERRRLTPPDATLGSDAYMAPEMFGGADGAQPEADVYALGVVAYLALSGRLPLSADSTRAYVELHREHAPVPELGDDLPPALDRAVRRALHWHGQARTHSALALADDLKTALRTSRREQLRTSAQQWEDARRSPGLLWGADVVDETVRTVPAETIGPLESRFLRDSQRWIRRARRLRRALVAVAALAVVGGLLYHVVEQARQATLEAQLAQEQTQLAQEQARSTREVSEAITTQAELEQGRSALLHDEPDAQVHLARAYQRGDRSPSTAFILARALEPRLAERARLPSTAGRTWSAAFSPDGRQIVTTDDRAAQVWDAQTYQRRFTLFHGDTVYRAVYSADGARIVTAGGDGTVKIWDAATGAIVRELRKDGARVRYFLAALSPDGRLIAAIDDGGRVAHVWDATTGALVAEVRNDGLESPSLAFSADGRWLATTGGSDVHVLDARTWAPVLVLRGTRIHRLAFDPSGARLLTGATTGDAAIWEVPSGARIRHLRDAGESVDAVAYSTDGRLVAAGSRDGTMQVWRARTGELQSQLNPRHNKISAVEFDRASDLVLGASADGTVVVAEARRGVPIAVFDGPPSVLVAHFDPGARRIVGASLDSAAWVWDATPPYRRWSSPPVGDHCDLDPELDRRFVAVGCRDHSTKIWDTARDQLLAELPGATLVAGDSPSAYPAVSDAGDRAAVARGGVVEVYELPGGRLLRTIAHGARVSAVAFRRAGRDVVSGATDGTLLVTREDGTRIVLPSASGAVDAVGFLPDGRVVAADAQRRLRAFDPGGAISTDLEIPTRARSLRVDGSRLVTVPVYTGGTASPVLVDLEHHQVIGPLEGHVGRVFSARWTTGGQILTAGADGTARLWDGATGHPHHVYRGGSRILADATLGFDKLVVAGGADGRLWFWDEDSERLLWALRAHASPIVGVRVEGAGLVTRGFTGELARWALPDPAEVIRACGERERCAIVDP
jgi:WD40 repeat protein/serine/threonine protein kinase